MPAFSATLMSTLGLCFVHTFEPTLRLTSGLTFGLNFRLVFVSTCRHTFGVNFKLFFLGLCLSALLGLTSHSFLHSLSGSLLHSLLGLLYAHFGLTFRLTSGSLSGSLFIVYHWFHIFNSYIHFYVDNSLRTLKIIMRKMWFGRNAWDYTDGCSGYPQQSPLWLVNNTNLTFTLHFRKF